jgi:hypothetical protein
MSYPPQDPFDNVDWVELLTTVVWVVVAIVLIIVFLKSR